MADPDGHGAAEMDQAHEDDPNDFSSPITTDDDDDDIVDHMGQTELLEVKLDTEQFRGSFHIPLGYDPSTLSMLGGGSFGSVAKVDFVDEQPHSIAIKKLTRPFQDVIFALRTAREMRVLKHLQGCESNNIVAYVGAYTPDTLDSLNQVYVVVEAMDMDLRKAFRSQLTEEHVRYIMYQVCNGLRYLHSAGILHRDLKPENIAISSNASVRLIDMGLCRTQHRIKDTPYVQTRFYRAPEVICMTEYDYSSDWWSFGCILAECYTGVVMFCGSSSVEQLRVIFDHLGPLPNAFLETVTSGAVMDYIKTTLDASLNPPRHLDVLPKLHTRMSPEAFELMQSLLVYEPGARPCADEIIYNRLFDDVRQGEPSLCSTPFDMSFEALAVDLPPHEAVTALRELVWQQCHEE